MKRIRLLHTADIHLDSAFAALGCGSRVGDQLREAQRRVFAGIAETARQWPADAVLIAGDLFDAPHVSDGTVDFVIETLERLSPIPVCIAPGNRDPFVAASPYAIEEWPDNVIIFRPDSWQAYAHPQLPLTIHGIGHDGQDASGARFKTLRIESDDRAHIVLAHGTEQTLKPASSKSFAPFDADDITRENPAYLALGHFHERVEKDVDRGALLRYPGSPQGRGFEEAGERCFLKVEMDCGGDMPPSVHVTPVSSHEILFADYEIACGGGDAWDELDALLPDPGVPCVARLRLTGEAPGSMPGFMEAVQEKARKRYLHAVIVNELHLPAALAGQGGGNCSIDKLLAALDARIADAPDRDTIMREQGVRDLAMRACRGEALPLPRLGEEAS